MATVKGWHIDDHHIFADEGISGTKGVDDRPELAALLAAAVQGRVFVVCYAYSQAANWQELEEAARQAIGTYRYSPYGWELYPCPAELAAQAVRCSDLIRLQEGADNGQAARILDNSDPKENTVKSAGFP